MQNVAQGWLVLELTDSAFMLGLVGFAGTLPWLILLLVGGVYADRLDRRRVLIRANVAMMVFAAALTVLTWTGVVRIWHVLAISLASGSAIALAAPAFQAFLHDLVDRRDLQNAIALNSAQFNLSRVVGPSIAGLTLGAIGLAGCFGINTLSYLAAIVALVLIRARSRPMPEPAPVWQSIVEGVGYVRERPRIRAILAIAALISALAMPYATLLPIVARDALGLDASGLGWLFAIGGVGAVAGAMSIAFPHALPRRGPWLLGCAIATGLATMALGLSRAPVAAAASLVGIGFFATSGVALSNTLLQELVDDAMRGRVLSMFGLAFMGTFPIANLLTGTMAGFTSASTTLAVTGALLAVIVGGIAVTRPRLRAIE
jgi:MFS family permease